MFEQIPASKDTPVTATHQFQVTHTTQNTINNWAVLGITMHPAEQTSIYWHGDSGIMKDIGIIRINTTGTIDIHPFAPATTEDLNILRGAGLEAARTNPSRKTAWTRHKTTNGTYWTCVISIPLNQHSSVAVAIRNHQSKELTLHETFNQPRTTTATERDTA